ncbi:hypothetical protein [Pedobacter glucosidilyticus]|uniref:hypothetical protein n=1 Tax=Pedobacter glucosidilyticus TaxID=1122941 RepID=UPI000403A345|nr:hypothetical protein [Pedobacter glucosidilyticus]
MANTAIIKGGKVIKTTGFDDLMFSVTEGFLMSFRVGNITYSHFNKGELRTDEAAYQKEDIAGYFDEKQFLEYLITPSVYVSNLRRFTSFIEADENEEVNISLLDVKENTTTPGFYFPINKKCSFLYNPEVDYVNVDGKLNLTGPFTEEPFSFSDLSNSFYTTNLVFTLTSDDTETTKENAKFLALTAKVIENIDNRIFNLFSEFSNLIDEQKNYWELTPVFSDTSTLAEFENYYKSTFNFYRSAYRNQFNIQNATGVKKLFWLASVMSPNSLSILSEEIKLELLDFIVKNVLVRSIFSSIDYEKLIVSIVKSVTPLQVDTFLNGLVDTNKYGHFQFSLFLSIYSKIDDSILGIGNNNKREFVFALYELWKISEYNPYKNSTFNQTSLSKFIYNDKLATNPDTNNSFFSSILGLDNNTLYFDASPISLDYSSTSFAGFYFDNFKFYFSSLDEREDFDFDFRSYNNTKDAPQEKILAVKDDYVNNSSPGLYGTYHYYQSVSLVNTSQETIISLPVIEGNEDGNPENINSLIPIFVLKYIDDAGDESDFNTAVGYFIDVVSIAAGGYGFITKLKYLRTLSGFTEAVVAGTESGSAVLFSLYTTIASEFVNVSAATTSLLIKISENSIYANEPWFKWIKENILWIELFSAGGSVLAENMLKISAKKLVDDFNTGSWPDEFVSDARGVAARNTLVKIHGLANETVIALVNQYKSRIVNNVNSKISKSDQFEIRKILSGGIVSDDPLHTGVGLDQIIANGFSSGLIYDELEGLLAISYRKGKLVNGAYINKQISTENLITQTTTWATVIKPRKYPFKFNNLSEFNQFKNEMTDLIEDFGIPATDVRIQGSSLRTSLSKDVDIAIFIDEKQLGEIKRIIYKKLKGNYIDSKGVIDMIKYEAAIKRIEKQISKGYIKNRQFGELSTGKTFMQEFRDRQIFSQDLDISIIIKGKSFDTAPYLKF